MNDRRASSLDRAGAVAGAAVVLLFLAIVFATPALPPPNRSIAEIGRAARDDASGILRGTYLAALLTGALLMFGASVAARIRRAGRDEEGWWIVALAGCAGTAIGLVTSATVTTFVRAVGHGTRAEALWATYPPGPDGVLIALPLAVFFLGAGVGGMRSGALSKWLGRLAVVLSVAFAVGAGGVTGDEVDGGILGVVLVLGYLGFLVWAVGVSRLLWRGSRASGRAAVGAAV